jgi:hypothetical protein
MRWWLGAAGPSRYCGPAAPDTWSAGPSTSPLGCGYMPSRRTLNRRDLPALCMLFGGLLGAGAVGIPLAGRLDLAPEGSLTLISGRVVNVYRTDLPKAGSKVHILVRAADRVHHLTQEDMSSVVSEIMSIRIGDNVAARVRPDFMGRDLDWLWELRRDGVTVLSYSDTDRFLQHRRAGVISLAYGMGFISICILAVGALLRRYFGAWSAT